MDPVEFTFNEPLYKAIAVAFEAAKIAEYLLEEDLFEMWELNKVALIARNATKPMVLQMVKDTRQNDISLAVTIAIDRVDTISWASDMVNGWVSAHVVPRPLGIQNSTYIAAVEVRKAVAYIGTDKFSRELARRNRHHVRRLRDAMLLTGAYALHRDYDVWTTKIWDSEITGYGTALVRLVDTRWPIIRQAKAVLGPYNATLVREGDYAQYYNLEEEGSGCPLRI